MRPIHASEADSPSPSPSTPLDDRPGGGTEAGPVWRNDVQRSGYLGIAHAYGGLAGGTVVDYRLDGDVVHHAWNPCTNVGDDRFGSVADLLAGLARGTVAGVCGCFTTLLDTSGAPAAAIDWAHELACTDDGTAAVQVHRSRYLRGLPIIVEARYAAFTDHVRSAAAAEEDRLTRTAGYRRELVSAALSAADRLPWLPSGYEFGDRWHPALPGHPYRTSGDIDEAFTALREGPHMWFLADDDEYATLGYRYATGYDPTHRGLARAPLALYGLLEHELGERFLGLDLGYPADQVAWAAARTESPREFHDTLTALRIAAAS